jgi:hypothetical protein
LGARWRRADLDWALLGRADLDSALVLGALISIRHSFSAH